MTTVALGVGSASGAGRPAGGGAARAAEAAAGGTAYWAEAQANPPNWIFPFAGLAYWSVANINEFQQLMYRPLYWLSSAGKPGLDAADSLAAAPVLSGDDVTISLKSWKWSNGETVDAQDVIFFLNMLRAEKSQFAGYVPGELPDNIVSVSAASPTSASLTIQFNRAYSSTWLLLSELSQLTPMPIAWDISSLGAGGKPAPPGSGGCSAITWTATVEKDCQTVWAFMTDDGGTSRSPKEAGDLATYATNPLWQVVDGPWHLTAFNAVSGMVTMAPNTGYSGSDKPHVSQFVEVPFTTPSAELTALKKGQLTVGYLPAGVAPPAKAPGGTGANLPALAATYDIGATYPWQMSYFPINFNSRGDGGEAGAIFRQLYFRQALMELVDQPALIAKYYGNYAVPDDGPVPGDPATSFLSPGETTNPYPYDVAKAVALLKAHGWTVKAGGTDVCAAAAGCGAGVKNGALLSFQLVYAAGTPGFPGLVTAEAASWHQAGIAVGLKGEPFNEVLATALPCAASSASCTWEMADWGGGWIFQPDIDPTGEYTFETGAPSNTGSYSDPVNDSLIQQTLHSSSSTVFQTWETYLAKQVPVVWQPTAVATIDEIAKGVTGVAVVNSLQTLTPEDWSLPA